MRNKHRGFEAEPSSLRGPDMALYDVKSVTRQHRIMGQMRFVAKARGRSMIGDAVPPQTREQETGWKPEGRVRTEPFLRPVWGDPAS